MINTPDLHPINNGQENSEELPDGFEYDVTDKTIVHFNRALMHPPLEALAKFATDQRLIETLLGLGASHIVVSRKYSLNLETREIDENFQLPPSPEKDELPDHREIVNVAEFARLLQEKLDREIQLITNTSFLIKVENFIGGGYHFHSDRTQGGPSAEISIFVVNPNNREHFIDDLVYRYHDSSNDTLFIELQSELDSIKQQVLDHPYIVSLLSQ